MVLRVEIGEVFLPRSPTTIGGLTLRQYQEELRCEDSKTVLVEAPTGSGKTLAYIARAMRPKDGEPFRTVIMVYPTNALIWDQVDAVERLLKAHFGLKVLRVDEQTIESGGLPPREADADVLLLAANGESLRALAEAKNSSEGKALVDLLRRGFEHRVILTNPDILYFLFLYKFAHQEDLISALLYEATPNLLVVDEAHLYYGYSLANLTYMFAYIEEAFDQAIFGSATPIDVQKIVGRKPAQIVATPSQSGDKVRHRCTLTVEGSERIASKDDLAKIVEKTDEFYKKHVDAQSKVKVLVILNSVLTCYALQKSLEEKYPGQVVGIHGLVPQAARPKTQSEFKDIVVGTSAVEVGVDFDTTSLIFEATDSATFIQRLGRGARHSPCEAYAYIPSTYLGGLTSRLKVGAAEATPKPTEYIHFVQAVSEALKKPQNYPDFPFSPQAAPILHAILINWAMERPAGAAGKPSPANAAKQLKQMHSKGSLHIPKNLARVFDYILCDPNTHTNILDQPDSCTLRMAEKISFRNTLSSLPAIFRPPKTPEDSHDQTASSRANPIFEYVSFDDLKRLQFTVKTKQQIKAMGLKIPLKMRIEERFLEVTAIRERPPKICTTAQKQKYLSKPTEHTGHIKTNPIDKELEIQISTLIDLQPALVLEKERDWRLQGIPLCDGGFLVVGGDAYVAWYINQT